MKKGKRKTTNEIELNPERYRTVRKKMKYKYLGILEADTNKQAEMKERVRK